MRQQETAEANWKLLFGEANAITEETAHVLIYGLATMTARQFKDLGIGLEARYTLARKALKMGPKEESWPGKIAVYLLEDAKTFHRFMRTVAKRRPDTEDSGVFGVSSDTPFVAACPPQTKHESAMDAQAGEQLAAAVLSKRGGDSIPDWLVVGFGRATAWRVAPAQYYNQRMQVKRLIKNHTAEDVWSGKLSVEEAPLLRASFAEFLAYGPGAETFPKLVDGFKPGPNGQAKSVLEAFKSVRLEPERINKAWLAFVAKGR